MTTLLTPLEASARVRTMQRCDSGSSPQGELGGSAPPLGLATYEHQLKASAVDSFWLFGSGIKKL